jgi:CheY-like chemotaxis protein
MDGYELARRFRADARFEPTVLVALSGYASGEDRRRAHAAGFEHHLAKPATFEQLMDVLTELPRRPASPRS